MHRINTFKCYEALKYFILISALSGCLLAHAQGPTKPAYQGLLWEITGNGLKKPSYLYATMHVSKKVAFHLDDSFFIALKSVDVVANETNPDSMLTQMLKSDYFKGFIFDRTGGLSNQGFDNTDFRLFGDRNGDLARGLSKDQDLLNGLLYRSSRSNEDFEEETYVDLFIFKTGKKLGKQVMGVENFDQMIRLVQEASAAQAEDYQKNNSKVMDGAAFSRSLIDAYRDGNLDYIDSLMRMDNASERYLNLFIYERNKNMMRSMDSVIKSGLNIFAGVGAAHLPGDKGIINLLRKAGYNVRPVTHTNKNSSSKESLSRMKYNLKYTNYTSSDSAFSIDVPGKLVEFPSSGNMQKYMFPEMVNGGFFSVTRIKTFAGLLGQDQEYTYKKIDSFLYENTPGKISYKKSVMVSDFPGYEVLSQTKNGNYQRFQIFATPTEIYIFKTGGTGAFAKDKSVSQFFNNIRIHQPPAQAAQLYKSPIDLFQVMIPGQPVCNISATDESKTNRHDYHAYNTSNGNYYLILAKDEGFKTTLDEDSFELNQLLDGVLETEVFTEKKRSVELYKNHHITWMEAEAKNRNIYMKSFLIGNKYYLFLCSTSGAKDDTFFNSIHFSTLPEDELTTYNDTAFKYSVLTPYKPEAEKSGGLFASATPKSFESHNRIKEYISYCGERITVEYYRYHKYFTSDKDSLCFWDQIGQTLTNYGDLSKRTNGPWLKDGYTQYEWFLTDTNNTRVLRYKYFLRGRILYTLTSSYDSLIGESIFIKNFFESFTPQIDAQYNTSIFTSHADIILDDLTGSDSAMSAAATQSLDMDWDAHFNPVQLPKLFQTIHGFYSSDSYLERKSGLISRVGGITSPSILPYLKDIYIQAGDTASYQVSVLEALAKQKNKLCYDEIKHILLTEPPLPSDKYYLNTFFELMEDSLKLSATLFPQLLNVITYEEYKSKIYHLLASIKDSNYIKPALYESFQQQMLNDLRIEWKRQLAGEEDGNTYGNLILEDLTSLLIPFYDRVGVKTQIEKLLTCKNDYIRRDISLLLLAHQIPVNDSIWVNLAAKDMFRLSTWQSLSKVHYIDKFPKKYCLQEAMARAILYQGIGSFIKCDSLTMLARKVHQFKWYQGNVYLYKFYNKEKSEWQLALSGLQPIDTSKFELNSMLTGCAYITFDEQKPIDEQFDKVIRLISIRARKKEYDNVMEDATQ
jgi:uncharacterized protein YbaP (TraB family)